MYLIRYMFVVFQTTTSIFRFNTYLLASFIKHIHPSTNSNTTVHYHVVLVCVCMGLCARIVDVFNLLTLTRKSPHRGGEIWSGITIMMERTAREFNIKTRATGKNGRTCRGQTGGMRHTTGVSYEWINNVQYAGNTVEVSDSGERIRPRGRYFKYEEVGEGGGVFPYGKLHFSTLFVRMRKWVRS